MKLFITSVKRVISLTTSPVLYVAVGTKNDTDEGTVDGQFEVEIKGVDFMKLPLEEIESMAIARVEKIIRKRE
ncbi:hypothetical protein [Microbulbifer spongiae]|uniref:Uncharacterized protein n=1 Tax=Microbulbifer spongiae TaxID=2944933 RepID=A0ABY9E7B4_9GAMM|nr:hypothetical protein [Microbulbifer sp. MI-G]WKD48355.1 hypothetical protein M8T91_10450 [Microbulbifer sp. MI-G]